MTIKLMDHQQEWVDDVLAGPKRELLDSHGLPLFGEAGTGKTYPMCRVAEALVQQHGGHAVFVVPTRLTWNWYYEHEQMCPEIPSLQRLVVGGPAADRARQMKYINVFGQFTNLFVFVGYDALRIERQFFQEMEDITILALDEAHAIKNKDTQRSRACKSIDAKFRFVLTGTPITNRSKDLWSVVHFLDPGPATMRKLADTPAKPGQNCPRSDDWRDYYKKVGCKSCSDWRWEPDYKHGKCKHGANKPVAEGQTIRYRRRSPTWGDYDGFEERYCRREWSGYGYKITGGRNTEELNRRLLDFGMGRWLIDEVLDLKPLMFNHVQLEPTTAEQRNYRRVASGIVDMLMDSESGAITPVERMHHLTILTYLRQCTVLTPHAFTALRGGLLDEILEYSGPLSRDDKSSKEEWLLDHLESTNGAKYLVYCHWVGPLDHLYHTLTQAGHKVERIYGRHGKGKGDAVRIMREFRDDPELRLVIGNESMSEGLNFEAARYVVYLHLPWLPKDVVQFAGRARRIGQKSTVVAYFVSHRNTIDVDMAQTCLSKQQDSDAILDPEFTGRSGMFNIETRQGLIELIRKHTE